MLFGIAVFGLLGLVAYKAIYGGLGQSAYTTLTDALTDRTDNGFQFRDSTYSDVSVDISHPDVRYSNNLLGQAEILGHAPDIYGTPTTFYQLQPGTSEISKINSSHLTTHLQL